MASPFPRVGPTHHSGNDGKNRQERPVAPDEDIERLVGRALAAELKRLADDQSLSADARSRLGILALRAEPTRISCSRRPVGRCNHCVLLAPSNFDEAGIRREIRSWTDGTAFGWMRSMADSHTTDDHPTGRPQKLIERVRHAIRLRHYSHRTEEAYVYWIRRYIVFHKKQHLSALGAR
jgi:hypothetical protein